MCTKILNYHTASEIYKPKQEVKGENVAYKKFYIS